MHRIVAATERQNWGLNSSLWLQRPSSNLCVRPPLITLTVIDINDTRPALLPPYYGALGLVR